MHRAVAQITALRSGRITDNGLPDTGIFKTVQFESGQMLQVERVAKPSQNLREGDYLISIHYDLNSPYPLEAPTPENRVPFEDLPEGENKLPRYTKTRIIKVTNTRGGNDIPPFMRGYIQQSQYLHGQLQVRNWGERDIPIVGVFPKRYLTHHPAGGMVMGSPTDEPIVMRLAQKPLFINANPLIDPDERHQPYGPPSVMEWSREAREEWHAQHTRTGLPASAFPTVNALREYEAKRLGNKS